MAEPTPYADSSFGRDRDPGSNPQGQAALLLVESLIHTLLDNGTLTKPQALEAIRSAVEVKAESAHEQEEPVEVLRKSLRLLADLERSIAAHTGRYHAGGATLPPGSLSAD